jgi:hypothetical protein
MNPAPGGIRTHTGLSAHRILSPKRLPFRHGGVVVCDSTWSRRECRLLLRCIAAADR